MESQVLEYIIKRKNEGALLATKIALIVGYVLLFLVLAMVIPTLASLFTYQYVKLQHIFILLSSDYQVKKGKGQLNEAWEIFRERIKTFCIKAD